MARCACGSALAGLHHNPAILTSVASSTMLPLSPVLYVVWSSGFIRLNVESMAESMGMWHAPLLCSRHGASMVEVASGAVGNCSS